MNTSRVYSLANVLAWEGYGQLACTCEIVANLPEASMSAVMYIRPARSHNRHISRSLVTSYAPNAAVFNSPTHEDKLCFQFQFQLNSTLCGDVMYNRT